VVGNHREPMSQESSPEKLLLRIAERDEKALGELYDLLAPALLGMLMRILNDRAAAEDVLEEVFLRIWSEAKRLSRENASVGAALFLLARAKAVERLRAERHLAPLFRTGLGRKILSRLPPSESVSRLDERHPLLYKVIHQLPKPQLGALELAVFEGLNESEIGVRLGEPAARVQSGLLAALRFLRHRLAAVMGTWAANI
jgi:RNA polymerase sigma-70 factor, ECF subfamily